MTDITFVDLIYNVPTTTTTTATKYQQRQQRIHQFRESTKTPTTPPPPPPLSRELYTFLSKTKKKHENVVPKTPPPNFFHQKTHVSLPPLSTTKATCEQKDKVCVFFFLHTKK